MDNKSKWAMLRRHFSAVNRGHVVKCPAYGITVGYFMYGRIVQRTLPGIGAFMLRNPRKVK